MTNSVLINELVVLENSIAFNWLNETELNVEFTEYSHNEMTVVINETIEKWFATNVDANTVQIDLSEIRMTVSDILAKCEYPESYVVSIDEMICKRAINPVNGLNSFNPYPRVFTKSTQEVKLKKMAQLKNYELYVVQNTRVTENTVAYNTMRCDVIGAKTAFSGIILKAGIDSSLVEIEDRKFLLPNEMLYVNDINVGDIMDQEIESFDNQVDSTLDMAFHTSFGLVNVVEYVKNIFGREILIVERIGETPFSSEEVIKEGMAVTTSQHECDRSELIFINSLRKEIKDKVIKVLSKDNTYKQYSVFSSSDYMDSEGATFDILNALDENVVVLGNLPREQRFINPSIAYQPKISLQREKAIAKATINGKINKDLLKLPVIPKHNVEIVATSELSINEGVTRYTAKITDNRQSFKIMDKDKNWKEQKLAPKVLTFCTKTFKFKIASPFNLHEISIPKEAVVIVKDKEIKLNLERKVVENKVVFSNEKHKKAFDIYKEVKDLRYKYIDPKTKEVITSMTNIIETDDLAEELGYPSDLITASRVSNTDYVPKQTFIDNCINNIVEELNVNEVTFKKKGTINSKNASVSIVISKGNDKYTIVVAKENGKFDIKSKISAVAKELLTTLAETIFTKAEDLNLN